MLKGSIEQRFCPIEIPVSSGGIRLEVVRPCDGGSICNAAEQLP